MSMIYFQLCSGFITSPLTSQIHFTLITSTGCLVDPSWHLPKFLAADHTLTVLYHTESDSIFEENCGPTWYTKSSSCPSHPANCHGTSLVRSLWSRAEWRLTGPWKWLIPFLTSRKRPVSCLIMRQLPLVVGPSHNQGPSWNNFQIVRSASYSESTAQQHLRF